MFSMYMSTLIESISYILKEHSTMEVMESWIRLCSYSLKFLLEAVILPENVRKLEYAANFNTILEDELKRRDDIDVAMKMARTMSEQSDMLSQQQEQSSCTAYNGMMDADSRRPKAVVRTLETPSLQVNTYAMPPHSRILKERQPSSSVGEACFVPSRVVSFSNNVDVNTISNYQ
jgi:hypothetical protein